jgi:hypothetical protein
LRQAFERAGARGWIGAAVGASGRVFDVRQPAAQAYGRIGAVKFMVRVRINDDLDAGAETMGVGDKADGSAESSSPMMRLAARLLGKRKAMEGERQYR